MEAAPACTLSSADALAVADRLFATEATWHQGYPLAQTLFTCLYVLQPERCESHVLTALMRVLLRRVLKASYTSSGRPLAGVWECAYPQAEA